MLFEISIIILIGAVVFSSSLGIQCLHENGKSRKYFGSCIELTQKGEVAL